jgi:hypothetical protein
MRSFACDLYREDGPGGGTGHFLAMPVAEAYGLAGGVACGSPPSEAPPSEERLAPAPFLKALSGHPVTSAAVEDGDVDAKGLRA